MGTTGPAVPDRIAWAVDGLGASGADRVLEVGCGPGVAAWLLSRRLSPEGRVIAIDRSAIAIDRTRTRNAEAVAAGRVVLQQVDLAGLRADPDSVDKALAVNVNIFWTSDAEEECDVLRRVLRPGGLVHLVYQGAPAARDLGPAVTATLARHGFIADAARHPSAPMVRITGRLP